MELHPPSPDWLRVADHWAAAIRRELSPLTPRVEHIGSTAVPGLLAKPVVDLQVSVPDVDDEASYRPALETLGLVLRAREPGHRFFRPPTGQPRTVHVHVCARGSTWERDHLAFRDRLRARPEVAAAYAALKQHLAATVGHDRVAYTEGKSAFVRSVLTGS
ncbi:GrpB family protein [Modestobacter excelsi]|uniref:GrpB family protein n=1 Tax=Modestobacter excelsi TaxID=2213161 RepID=UPI001FEC2FA1|nr:GrpB family protein [Modestobacter excelsi]